MTGSKDYEHDALLAELTNALSDKTDSAVAARIALRDAVCAFVIVEHARGVPLDSVIRTVKDILRTAESGAMKASDELAVQLIDWCIEFHPAQAAGPAVIS